MIEYLLASSFDNCVDTCLSLLSVAFVDVWDFDADPLENFSRRRRRSLIKTKIRESIFNNYSIKFSTSSGDNVVCSTTVELDSLDRSFILLNEF